MSATVFRLPATISLDHNEQGDALSFREFLAERRQSASRLGPGRFGLQHIPVFGEDAAVETHDVRSSATNFLLMPPSSLLRAPRGPVGARSQSLFLVPAETLREPSIASSSPRLLLENGLQVQGALRSRARIPMKYRRP
jgi:hypothetical protein